MAKAKKKKGKKKANYGQDMLDKLTRRQEEIFTKPLYIDNRSSAGGDHRTMDKKDPTQV